MKCRQTVNIEARNATGGFQRVYRPTPRAQNQSHVGPPTIRVKDVELVAPVDRMKNIDHCPNATIDCRISRANCRDVNSLRRCWARFAPSANHTIKSHCTRLRQIQSIVVNGNKKADGRAVSEFCLPRNHPPCYLLLKVSPSNGIEMRHTKCKIS